MPVKKVKKEKHWLNKNEMSASLGISATAFDKWGVAPVAKIGREAFFVAKDVVANRVANSERLAKKSQPTFDDRDIEEQRLRLTTAQAKNMEIKNDIAEGNVVPVDITSYSVSKFCSECAGILDSVPLKIRRRFPDLSVQHIDVIKSEIIKAQNIMGGGAVTLEKDISDYISTLA